MIEAKQRKKEKKLNVSKQICHFEFDVLGLMSSVSVQNMFERNLFSRVTIVGRHSQNDW